VLITAGETPTKVTNRKTNLVYSVGDGGAAVIISKIDDRNRGLEIGWLNSEGSFSGILGSGGSLPPNKMDVDADAYYMEIGSNADDFISNAWKQIPTVLLEDKNYKAEDVAALIPHQVNKKVMANICEASDIPAERTVDLISQYGNCGSASVLIALDHAVTTGMVKENDLAMLAVVGGGISWGGLLVRV
jgi:3-oxoacyl-[acyl-carrier-protein] synthase-3